MNASSDAFTPNLTANDSRGLTVRTVAYRQAKGQEAACHVTLSRHDLPGQSRRQWDPRLFERLEQGREVAPSQNLSTSLSGSPVLSESVDAGYYLILHGEAGQVVERWDTRDNHWHTTHDELLRPVQVRENAAGQAPRIAERFTYGQENRLNRRGRLVRHDDEAGSRLIDGYVLTGEVHSETRHFLADLDLPDWPEPLAERDALLEPGAGASSVFVQGPLAEVLEQTDAQGNRQAFRFTPSGELASMELTLHDGSQYPVLVEARYNAFGQIESQTAGNGVVSRCEYEPATGRLSRLSASRPGRSIVQDLHYDYDPVGNVLKIEDRSQPVTHFANQRVDPVNIFRYDSLYQLIEATGREALGALIGPQLPELAPGPGDTSKLLNYRQHYDYDPSGNLKELRHVGHQSYTRTMTVADHSNHAVPAPGDPLSAFDPNGNLLDLDAGLPLRWSARNQLHGTRQVAREDGADDEEHYRYGGDGLRVRKVGTRLVAGRMQSSETRYLPGLELHVRPGESFAVITTQAGRCAVRCLLWSEGRPDGLANPQLRYSLDDHLSSNSLELDGEARIISHEGYYPFGGTAWWAARSAVEAGYKTRRYSGKERDGSGLYDYGLRYYAPWLMRWINPDPAGDIDGLNRYRFVANNPLSHVDPDGRNKIEVSHYPPGQSVAAPAAMQAGAGYHPHLSMVLSENPSLHGFAYDLTWTVRDLLPLGPGNQLSSAYATNLRSYDLLTRLREQANASTSDDSSTDDSDLDDTGMDEMEIAEHAIAIGTGLCGEHAFIAVLLAASSARWPGVPVSHVGIDGLGHDIALLGDPRAGNPLVVDPWVLYPILHPLSASRYLSHQDSFHVSDYTPRMPEDPEYEITWQGVDDARPIYQDIPVREGRASYAALRQLGDVIWHQVSAMRASSSVNFTDQAGSHVNAAWIPAHHFESMQRSIDLANEFLTAHPNFAFRRF